MDSRVARQDGGIVKCEANGEKRAVRGKGTRGGERENIALSSATRHYFRYRCAIILRSETKKFSILCHILRYYPDSLHVFHMTFPSQLSVAKCE